MRGLFNILVILLAFVSLAPSAQQGSSKYSVAVEAYQSGDFPTAEHLWSELALQGDARAQYALGIMHLKEEAQRSSDATAFQYLVEAAKQQHVAAMFNLGVAYWEGRGVFRQPEKAANWWEAAAEENDPGAQYNLGLAYYIGEGREQDTQAAVHWLQEAADNGHIQAQELLERHVQGEQPLAQQSEEPAPVAANTSPNGNTEAPAARSSSSTGKERESPAVSTIVLRAQPDATAVSVTSIQADTPLTSLKTRNGWTQVQLAAPYPVWIYASLVEDLGTGQGKVRGNQVNVRPGPSTDNRSAPPLGQLNDGDTVEIIERREAWFHVMPSRAFPAWVKSSELPR